MFKDSIYQMIELVLNQFDMDAYEVHKKIQEAILAVETLSDENIWAIKYLAP